MALIVMEETMILPWWLWQVPVSYHDNHCHHYNVERTLVVQSTLVISAQYLLTKNMLEEPSAIFREETYTRRELFPKNSKLSRLTKNRNIYVTSKLLLNKALLSDNH